MFTQTPNPSVREQNRRPEISPSEISFAAVGDIMLGTSWPNGKRLPPDDGKTLLTEVTPILSAADVAFGNLEGPLVDDGTTTKCRRLKARCYAFRVPTRYGQYLKDAGFDVLSLANNHALDFGEHGRQSTKAVLDQLEIAHSGEIGDIAHLVVNGRKIDLIAFAPYNTAYNLTDIHAAAKSVSDSAAQADLVVVSFHGGAEGAGYQHVPRKSEKYWGENRGNLRTFAHAMIDAGAHLVLGHGPHLVRGMEVYRHHLIAYSLGNFATYGPFNLAGPRGLSLILEVRLGPGGEFLGGQIHPVKQVKPGGPKLDSEGTIIPMVRQLSRKDFGKHAVVVENDGRIVPPPPVLSPAVIPKTQSLPHRRSRH